VNLFFLLKKSSFYAFFEGVIFLNIKYYLTPYVEAKPRQEHKK
jgi:hypothetical protein